MEMIEWPFYDSWRRKGYVGWRKRVLNRRHYTGKRKEEAKKMLDDAIAIIDNR